MTLEQGFTPEAWEELRRRMRRGTVSWTDYRQAWRKYHPKGK